MLYSIIIKLGMSSEGIFKFQISNFRFQITASTAFLQCDNRNALQQRQ